MAYVVLCLLIVEYVQVCLIWTFITIIYNSPKAELVKDYAEDY